MHNGNILVRIIAVALLLYSLSCLASAADRLRNTRRLAEELRAELAELEQENEELTAALEQEPGEQEMGRLARERLGMVMPDEKVFYFITDREEAQWSLK